MFWAILDSVSPLEKIKLIREYNDSWNKSQTAKPIERINLIKRLNEIAMQLEWIKSPEAVEPTVQPTEQKIESATTDNPVRQSTAQYFEFRETAAGRQKDNDRAIALLEKFNKNPDLKPTDEEKRQLAKFTGFGGNLENKVDGKKGSAFEYYTPKPVAEGIWDVVKTLGFTGGKVLDPCSGTGIFGAVAPESAAIDAVELSPLSGRIGQLVNDGPGYKTTISNFESVAANTPDGIYDAVVTNVPFGTNKDRGTNAAQDPRYSTESLQYYFILRSLEKLKPRGLAAFIVPMSVVSNKGGKEENLRLFASYMAEFVGAYRLPSGTFKGASTDTATDVIFFRKYSEDVAQQIASLKEQKPEVLNESKVIWDTFVSGKYFDSAEGQKYVLGTFVPKDPNEFRSVDRVVFNGQISELRDLFREKPLPKSRINWELLEATETAPIVYKEGDTIYQAGCTLTMRNGKWELTATPSVDFGLAETLEQLKDPYSAFENNVSWTKAQDTINWLEKTSRYLDIPDWLRDAVSNISKVKKQTDMWHKAKIALSVKQVIDEHSSDPGFNYLEEFEALSNAIIKAGFKKTDSKVGGEISPAIKIAMIHYNKKEFSNFWKGKVETKQSEVIENAINTPEGRIAKLLYEHKGTWLQLEEVKQVLGQDFDPFSNDDWCISPDGTKVTYADDFFIGNYQKCLDQLDNAIASTTDDKIKNKLLREKEVARSRVNILNIDRLTYDLRCPTALVSNLEKIEFLLDNQINAYIDDGKIKTSTMARISSSSKSDAAKIADMREKIKSQIGDFINGSSVSIGNIGRNLPEKARQAALDELNNLIKTLNVQFDMWCKSNPDIQARIKAMASDPKKLRFVQNDDESEIAIAGMNPSLKLHGYQAAYVRRMGREFSGINGFGVGLGKTFTALAAVQHVQAMGAKKKTLFVVPKSVLANWKSESEKAYTNTDDCLYVGLKYDKKGNLREADGQTRKEQLWQILENKHSKVFMSIETFKAIMIKEETIREYASFLRTNDKAFEITLSRKNDERNLGSLQIVLNAIEKNKDKGNPYIEDMGFDSLVIDEAHKFKNSAKTVEFQGAKYLSESGVSAVGLDAQIKAWFIRGGNPNGDGVLMLTATPITNSPLEIYSMLSLAKGVEKVNDDILACHGADDFMKSFCMIANEESEQIDGVKSMTDIFTGLMNLDTLRYAVSNTITIKTAADVGAKVKIPEREEVGTKVTLDEQTMNTLTMFKMAYRYAKEWNKDNGQQTRFNRGDGDPKILNDKDYQNAFETISKRYRLKAEILGHPFNLLNRMQNITLDPDNADMVTRYFTNDPEKSLIVCNTFNSKNVIEERDRLSPYTQDNAIVKEEEKEKKDKTTGELRLQKIYTVHVMSDYVEGGAIQVDDSLIGDSNELDHINLDSTDPDTQDKFEVICNKNKLNLDVKASSKLAAFVANFQKEMSTPRGVINGEKSSVVKQLVFCDAPAIHNKIKHLLVQRCGISPSKIAIITGQRNNEADEIEEVADGFNADGKDNKYNVIIANEKAEVGINLQKGTQAIHHLTTGWTPDSLEQRNGRGARQGNQTEKVTIYYYDAAGTFDEMKRAIVNHKADWISQVLDKKGAEKVTIAGRISDAQAEALLESTGDEEAQRIMNEKLAAEERAQNIRIATENQDIALKILLAKKDYLQRNKKFETVISRRKIRINNLWVAIENQKDDIEKAKKAKKGTKLKEDALADMQREFEAQCNAFDKSVTIVFLDKELDSIKWLFENGRADSYGIKYKIKENAPLYKKWESDLAQAKSMLEEAKQKIKKEAEGFGNYTAEIADEAASESNNIWLINNKVVAKDSLIRFYMYGKEQLGVLEADRYSNDVWLINDRNQIESYKLENLEFEAVVPHSLEFDKYVRKAAELEDRYDQDPESDKSVQLPYSKFVPLVWDYRKAIGAHEYAVAFYALPSPYFPIAIRPSDPDYENNPMFQKIIEEQKDVITWPESGYTTRFISALPNIVRKDYSDVEKLQIALDYSKAHGFNLKDTYRAFGISVYSDYICEKAADVARQAPKGMTDAKTAINIYMQQYGKGELMTIMAQADDYNRWYYERCIREVSTQLKVKKD